MQGLGSYFKANPDTAGKVLGAFTEGIYYYKTHPEDGMAALRSRGGDAQTAKEIYQKVADSYRTRPDPDLSSIAGVLASLPDERAKKIRPEALVDPVPWERVVQSGLLERLYGKKGAPAK
jgi:ABC-type nitrate/sulfonate/bicarbonate transport system substrate-binding protein